MRVSATNFRKGLAKNNKIFHFFPLVLVLNKFIVLMSRRIIRREISPVVSVASVSSDCTRPWEGHLSRIRINTAPGEVIPKSCVHTIKCLYLHRNRDGKISLLWSFSISSFRRSSSSLDWIRSILFPPFLQLPQGTHIPVRFTAWIIYLWLGTNSTRFSKRKGGSNYDSLLIVSWISCRLDTSRRAISSITSFPAVDKELQKHRKYSLSNSY